MPSLNPGKTNERKDKKINNKNNNTIKGLVMRSTPFCTPKAQIAKAPTVTTNVQMNCVVGLESIVPKISPALA